MFVCFFHHNFHCPPCTLLGWQRFLSTTPLRYGKAYYSISQYDHRGINHSQYRGCTLLFEATITYQKSSTRAKRYNGRPIIDVVRCALLLTSRTPYVRLVALHGVVWSIRRRQVSFFLGTEPQQGKGRLLGCTHGSIEETGNDSPHVKLFTLL